MICSNYDKIKSEIGSTMLLAVSKTQQNDKIMTLYNHGVKSFGENRINELKMKKLVLPDDIDWHFIGRLQTKKVRDVVKNADLIHSVDTIGILETIDKESAKIGKVQRVLIQINASGEESKTGFYPHELDEVVSASKKLSNVCVVGLMTMAPFTDDEEILREVFDIMKKLYNSYDFEILSMGMSNDYKLAIEYGATLIRVGTSIFNEEE